MIRIVYMQMKDCHAARQHALQQLLASPDTAQGLLALAILNAIDASGLGQITHPEISPSPSGEPNCFDALRCLGMLAANGFRVPNVTLSRSLGRERMEQVSVCLWECLALRLRRFLTVLEGCTADGPIKNQLEVVTVLKTILGAAADALDTAAATDVVTLVVC